MLATDCSHIGGKHAAMDSGRVSFGSALHRDGRRRETPIDSHVSDRRPALLRVPANAAPQETNLARESESNRPSTVIAQEMVLCRRIEPDDMFDFNSNPAYILILERNHFGRSPWQFDSLPVGARNPRDMRDAVPARSLLKASARASAN
jgi:hypothetical protein